MPCADDIKKLSDYIEPYLKKTGLGLEDDSRRIIVEEFPSRVRKCVSRLMKCHDAGFIHAQEKKILYDECAYILSLLDEQSEYSEGLLNFSDLLQKRWNYIRVSEHNAECVIKGKLREAMGEAGQFLEDDRVKSLSKDADKSEAHQDLCYQVAFECIECIIHKVVADGEKPWEHNIFDKGRIKIGKRTGCQSVTIPDEQPCAQPDHHSENVGEQANALSANKEGDKAHCLSKTESSELELVPSVRLVS